MKNRSWIRVYVLLNTAIVLALLTLFYEGEGFSKGLAMFTSMVCTFSAGANFEEALRARRG